jgi:hypothetical protein
MGDDDDESNSSVQDHTSTTLPSAGSMARRRIGGVWVWGAAVGVPDRPRQPLAAGELFSFNMHYH